MLLLPVPLVAALVLAFLLARALIRREGTPLLLALVAAGASQATVVALVQHYGLVPLRPLQPVTATLLPPLAWLAFIAAAARPLTAKDAAHALVPLAAAFSVTAAPVLVDAIVIGAFAGYGLALLVAARPGAALPTARLSSGEVPARTWRAIGVLLLASAASDALIAADMVLGAGAWRAPIISAFTAGALLAIGALALSRDVSPPADDGTISGEDEPVTSESVSPESRDPQDAAREAELIARLDALMARERPHLDPDLTLARLARRLGVPAKVLSAAINRAHAENVSRFVNRHRVAHACGLLVSGEGVTRAMLESGFGTKSNFNREFLRVTGTSPTAWLAERRG
ncbi:helix-turn-helix domain-containing protein [Salinarimonas ramus]|uniref:AraC family transcriptional regulator n=1 Tax=Salinarimonas ramus TaxID=690164 RepID=A0A917V1U7_9HYPH|nr:helix-turn-helix domain-containing protein [Salinarimonas ramus]GGK17562.1 AraC family transcriptional regulator [Salinarimonas ramus]